jgi:hypothetical protein
MGTAQTLAELSIMPWVWPGLSLWLLGIYPMWRWAIPRIDRWFGNVPMTPRGLVGWQRRNLVDALFWPVGIPLVVGMCALAVVVVPVALMSEGCDRIRPWFMRRWPWTYFYSETEQ